MATATMYAATGKRKSAIARVRMKPGNGEIVVNKRALEDYFSRPTLQMKIRQPFEVTGNLNKYDVSVNVIGGGLAGQADAVKHGISRALLEVDATNRKTLKPEGLLTRDSRIKERKKYGHKKARKRFQYSKR